MGFVEPDPRVFTLEGQIQHKIHFIQEFIPDDVEIVLIGHSFGAYMTVEIMERLDSDRVIQGSLTVSIPLS